MKVDYADFLAEAKLYVNQHIRPFAQKFDVEQFLPGALLKGIKDNGYLRANLPEQYGGLGFNFVAYGLLTEEIGKACCSVRALLTVHCSLVMEAILRCANTEQKKWWLPRLGRGELISAFALSEEGAGSDARSISLSYENQSDSFVLTGKKKWVTFGALADLALVFARSGDMCSAFLVDLGSEGISRIPIEATVNRASYLAELHFNRVRVPKDRLISLEGNGFNYVANCALEAGRYSIAWGGVAIAHEALDVMVNYAKNRKQFGTPLCQFQLIQGMIADAKTELEAARSLCMQAGLLRDKQDCQAGMYVNMAKLFSSRLAVKVSNVALQIFGAKGFEKNSVVQRLYREAKLLEVIEGSTQIQQQIIASDTLNLHAKEYCYDI